MARVVLLALCFCAAAGSAPPSSLASPAFMPSLAVFRSLNPSKAGSCRSGGTGGQSGRGWGRTVGVCAFPTRGRVERNRRMVMHAAAEGDAAGINPLRHLPLSLSEPICSLQRRRASPGVDPARTLASEEGVVHRQLSARDMAYGPRLWGGRQSDGKMNHPGDNNRANGTSQNWTRPGMPSDSGGILRGCPLLGGVNCPNVVSRVERIRWRTSQSRRA